MNTFKAWWTVTAWPFLHKWTVTLTSEWWADIGDKPRPHFVSIVLGMALYHAVKFFVWFAAAK